MMACIASNEGDEITAFINMRYLSSIEAIWRIFEYATVGQEPTVTVLPVHLEGQNLIFFNAENSDEPPRA